MGPARVERACDTVSPAGSGYRLTGPEYFVFHRLEVHYDRDGPIHYTDGIDIAITVTPAPGGPIAL
jgi:hypothetical protein